MNLYINLSEIFDMLYSFFGNIFEFLIVILTIILAASLLILLISRGNKGITVLICAFGGIILCVLFNFLIYGDFPSLPPFLQFIEEWIREIIGL